MSTVGIDPGKLATAVVVLGRQGEVVASLTIIPPRSASLWEAIDYITGEILCTFIVENAPDSSRRIAIEDPWQISIAGNRGHGGAREKTGVSIAAALYAVFNPAEMVPVSEWKRSYKLNGIKRSIAAQAQAAAQAGFLFPGYGFRNQHEIDAALLANYYRQRLKAIGK